MDGKASLKRKIINHQKTFSEILSTESVPFSSTTDWMMLDHIDQNIEETNTEVEPMETTTVICNKKCNFYC